MATKTRLPEVELKRERAARELERLIREAPGSLAAHATLVHRDNNGRRIVAHRHHMEWVRVLEDPETYPGVVVVAPPGYAKSTWFSVIYPTWRIGASGGTVRMGLISNTATLAVGFSRAVQDSLQTPEFRAAYPKVMPDRWRKWTESQWYVTGAPEGPNPTVLATGIGGAIQGKRFDEIILDDPTNQEEAGSQEIMAKQRRWLRGTLIQRFPPGMRPPEWSDGGRMVVVMTRWGQNDLLPELEDLGFKIVHMPALGYWDRTVDPETGEVVFGEAPLWPEAETREQLMEERENDELMFELVKQGNPNVLAGDQFKAEWFQRAALPPRSAFSKVVQYVDTAGGKDRKRGDFFALATVGRRGNEVWIMDMVRKRLAAPEQEAAVIQAHEQWQPDRVVIEDVNEGTALFQRLSLTRRMPLKPVVPQRDKEFRAIPLSNAYRTRRVFHPERERWVPSYEAELQAFPAGPHDDQVDAAAGAFNELGEEGPRVRVLG